jgi:hypothetical protein
MREELNWYKTAQVVEKLYQEAGIGKWIPVGIISALLAIMTGSGINNALKQYNVSKEDLNQALNNREVVSKIQNAMQEQGIEWQTVENILNNLRQTPIQTQPSPPHQPNQSNQPSPQPNQPSNITINTVIDSILDHENLLPGQTPFRITSPAMRRWDRIFGYRINRNPAVPSNRRNFLFLQKPGDVTLAIRRLFERYNNNPGRYGLDANPSLADAIRTFDQSNAEAKISFLNRQIPNLDVNRPLGEFIR